MAEKKEKVEYAKSTAQVDLETRLADDAVPRFDQKVNPAPATDEGYVGVNPEYQNAANEYEEPLEAEEGGFADAEAAFADAYGDGSDSPSEDVQTNYKNVRRENDTPPEPTPSAADVKVEAPAAGTTSPSAGATGSTTDTTTDKSDKK